MQAYLRLEELFTRLYRLDHFLLLGDWDLNVHMPPKGETARGEAMATLSEIRFGYLTAPEVAAWLTTARTHADADLSSRQRANLREMEMEWRRATALPADFAGRKTRLTTRAHNAWKESRAANDFSKFLPVLKELVALAREEGACLAVGTSMSPYEALMNQYEPGITTAKLDEVFEHVKSWLPQLLKDVVKKQSTESVLPFARTFPRDKQEAMGHDIVRLLHFDMDAGRLDVSPHAFTGMTKEDCRLTNNYVDESFVPSVYGVIHEGGHGKYEQNCGPRDMITQPVCKARSMGVHESQSLLAEFQIGRSAAFMEFLSRRAVEHFGAGDDLTPTNLTKIMQRVQPGYIRIDADELCYPLHVILRYEIERDLMEGKIEAEDVPRVWSEKMQSYLGLSTEGRDDLGCLQDIHWSMGILAYFPTYTIGAMYAAQIMASIRKELGDDKVDQCLRSGELAPILAKQQEKIWDHGCLYETDDLMTRATGETLNPDYLRRHLEARYLNA
ncbi:carboxypeptidase [Novymonas esmeraldas]|uniref:carboxypeptidase Taq n=1 Tax=Novymonas esmeraldas TaxID=1808958 RepID=A0AAW0F509_9TRYP